MALTGESKALTVARAGLAKFGAMRAGYAPTNSADVQSGSAAALALPVWKESFVSGNRPSSTSWTSSRS
jgi:hypothetical protein